MPPLTYYKEGVQNTKFMQGGGVPPSQKILPKRYIFFVNPSLNKDNFQVVSTVSVSMTNVYSQTDFTVTKVMSWKVENCVC